MLFEMKKILCPVDFSDHSNRALQTACELAVDYEAELLLVHVVSPVPVTVTKAGVAPAPSAVLDIKAHEEALRKHAVAELEALKEEKVPKDIKTSLFVAVGHESDTVVEFAKEQGVDLIVITTHGRSGLKRLLMGSVAEGIIRHSTKPVLSIRVAD